MTENSGYGPLWVEHGVSGSSRGTLRSPSVANAAEPLPVRSVADEMVAAVVPRCQENKDTGVTCLPVAKLGLGSGDGSVRYSVASVDDRGRIADRIASSEVGWRPGERLRIETVRDVVLVVADERGAWTLSRQGYVRIPAAVRGWCGLGAGQRVLLAAMRDHSAMVVHPPTVMDAMVHAYYQTVVR